ncbi:MAG: ATP phosphoribosyltransferase [bacterium]|nr:ATP phosphoribosyltransferase [bacterium]
MKGSYEEAMGTLSGVLPNGSLEEGTVKLFEDAYMPILRSPRQHDALVESPLVSEVTFARPQHAPRLVEKGSYDFGICGTDCVAESGADVVILAELLYGRGTSTGRTKIVLLSADDASCTSLESIPNNTRILSEYPNITRSAFEKAGTSVAVDFSYGGTEAHIPRDYPFGVCVSDSGKSLRVNHKKVVAVLFESCTALIANRRAWETKREALTLLKHTLVGTIDARNSVFVLMNVSAKKKTWVLRQLPAMKKPTVAKLSDRNYFSVGAVVRKSELSTLAPRLLQNGAEDLVEMPISKVIQSW